MGRDMTTFSDSDAQDIIATAAALADAARVATLQHFRSDGLTADNKEAARFDPVTVADRLVRAADAGDFG